MGLTIDEADIPCSPEHKSSEDSNAVMRRVTKETVSSMTRRSGARSGGNCWDRRSAVSAGQTRTGRQFGRDCDRPRAGNGGCPCCVASIFARVHCGLVEVRRHVFCDFERHRGAYPTHCGGLIVGGSRAGGSNQAGTRALPGRGKLMESSLVSPAANVSATTPCVPGRGRTSALPRF